MINENPAPKPTPIRPKFTTVPPDPDIKAPEAVRRRVQHHPAGTTNVIPFPKGLASLKFTIPPEGAAEIMNDTRKELAAIADPVEAVQFVKTRSVALLGAFTGHREPEDKWTPEGIAEADQIAEALLADYPCKNANGETIEMSIPEAFALYSEQDKVQRRGLEHVSLSPPPTFPKVDLPLAITSKNGFHRPDHPHFVITLREILATCRDPVQAAAAAKDDAIMLIKDLPEYSKFSFTPEGEMLIKDPNEYREFTFTPEEIAEAKRVAEILLADLPRNQQQFTKEKDQEDAQARLSLQRHNWLKPYLAKLASSLSSSPKKPNGAAPISPLPSDDTGLAAFADPKTLQDAKRKMPAFRDFIKKGKPRPSLANARIAINALGIDLRWDNFHHKIVVRYHGQSATISEGILLDRHILCIRSLINNTYRIDCGDFTWPAIQEIAYNNTFDPVLDYLDECQGKWDHKKRIDTWVIDYMGVEDTPLHRAIGRLMLIASVRRARSPGCKFDQICVLESEKEGFNKSTAIKIMAGEENFSDQSVLNVGEREAQEQLEGIWLHESADLTGLKKAEVERVKAFASRQFDRARPAYARVREDRPRRCTQWATTNDNAYLASQTGNRRFWPLPVDRIDIGALQRDRDQLWGEAATLEAAGVSIMLDPKLWPAEHAEQEKRRIPDPWEDLIENMPASVTIGSYLQEKDVQIIYQDTLEGKELVRSADVLAYVLQVPTGHQHPEQGKRLVRAMKRFGWRPGRVSILGRQCRGYWRPMGLAATSLSAGQQPDRQ